MPAIVATVLPVGTQVVTRVAIPGPDGQALCPRGAVGVIVAAPAGDTRTYRVNFPDGAECAIGRQDLAVRKRVAAEGLESGAKAPDEALYASVIYRCVIGSRAYGLDDEGSDTDCLRP